MGVEKSATPDEIKRAYRKLARKYHPDVNKEPDAEEKFKTLGEAYDVLKDKEKRAQYDALGEQYQQYKQGGFTGQNPFEHTSHQGANVDFGDIFSSIFGQAGHSRRESYYDKGQDIHATLNITLEDSFFGQKKTIQLQDDKGGVKAVNVAIPKGIIDKQQIRLKGQGATSPSGKKGDLFIEVHISPHHLFQRKKRDLYLTLPIAPWEAALGTSVTVPTLSGSVKLTIPKLSQNGKILRLKGKGLPSSTPGDLFVTLNIVIPTEANSKNEELYKALKENNAFNPREHLGS